MATKAIDKLTTEELLAEKQKQADAAKAAKAMEAAIDLRLATQSIIDVVKTLRVPELFAKIREKASNADLTDTAILSAIAEAAGITGVTIANTVKKTAKRGTGSATPKTPEAKALTKAGNLARDAKKAVTEAEEAAKDSAGKSQPERVALKAAVTAAKEKAEELIAAHAALKAANKTKREAAKKK